MQASDDDDVPIGTLHRRRKIVEPATDPRAVKAPPDMSEMHGEKKESDDDVPIAMLRKKKPKHSQMCSFCGLENHSAETCTRWRMFQSQHEKMTSH